MKIVITQYPFFREDFAPTPSDEEKSAYIGLVLVAVGLAPEKSIQAHIPFPGGAYQVPIYNLLEVLIKLSEEQKRIIIPRWIPYLDIAKVERKKGYGMLIPIAADCCEEIGTLN